MATATRVMASTPAINLMMESDETGIEDEALLETAIGLAILCRAALNTLASELSHLIDPSRAFTAEEILSLPLDEHRIADELLNLPSRRSSRHHHLAELLATLLHPTHKGSLTAVIRYNADRVRLRAWAVLQRRYDLLKRTKAHGKRAHGLAGGAEPRVQAPVWASRIGDQGPWDPATKAISLDGVRAVPMPVRVSSGDELAPFLLHLQRGGSHELQGDEGAVELDQGKGEPYYGVRAAEFRKGVLYQDGRMDLCKMVVGPDHISSLMKSLRTNTFVRHFLLGNNIIGPSGARAIADFIHALPDRMETWYLAGNCIDGASFSVLVDALIESEAVTQVWLKRNPLGRDAAHDVYRLITQTKDLQTLDLDQTEMGNSGVAALFDRLAAYTSPGPSPSPSPSPEKTKLPLRQLYLNGNGISKEGAAAMSRFLVSPHCGITSVYMSNNPLGDEGAKILARALPTAPYLKRLLLQSTGVSTQGAVALFRALAGHRGIRCLDLGQSFATEDLGQAYNFVDDGAIDAIKEFLCSTPQIQYLDLGHCAITPSGLMQLTPAILASPSLMYFGAIPITADVKEQAAAAAAATFTPGTDTSFADPDTPSLEQIRCKKAIKEHLEANVRAHYWYGSGSGTSTTTYTEFLREEKRWLVSDKAVRKIDSVYRNREAGMARRGLTTLVKHWEVGDDVLERIMSEGGSWPMCSLKRR